MIDLHCEHKTCTEMSLSPPTFLCLSDPEKNSVFLFFIWGDHHNLFFLLQN